MSYYRRVDIRMWGDQRFRALTPAKPSGQSLWIWLLTGGHTGSLPGLFKLSRVAAADDLGWKMHDFDRCFAEIEAQKMVRADWEAKVVWIPKAPLHNPASNPNTVKAWGKEFDAIPECTLKAQAWVTLRQYLKGFPQLFKQLFPQPLQLTLEGTVTVTEEKRREEKRREPGARARANPNPEWLDFPDRKLFERYWERGPRFKLKETEAAKLWCEFCEFWDQYPNKDARYEAWKAYLKFRPDLEQMFSALFWQMQTEQWKKDRGKFVPKASKYIRNERYNDEPPNAVKKPQTRTKKVSGPQYDAEGREIK